MSSEDQILGPHLFFNAICNYCTELREQPVYDPDGNPVDESVGVAGFLCNATTIQNPQNPEEYSIKPIVISAVGSKIPTPHWCPHFKTQLGNMAESIQKVLAEVESGN